MLQVAAGGGLTEPRLRHHFIHGKTALTRIGKQGLYARQRILLDPFTAVIQLVVLCLQLIQRIHVLLIDDLPHPLLLGELHKTFQ